MVPTESKSVRVLIVEDDGDYVDYLKLVVPECCPGPSAVDAVDNTGDAIAKLGGGLLRHLPAGLHARR